MGRDGLGFVSSYLNLYLELAWSSSDKQDHRYRPCKSMYYHRHYCRVQCYCYCYCDYLLPPSITIIPNKTNLVVLPRCHGLSSPSDIVVQRPGQNLNDEAPVALGQVHGIARVCCISRFVTV